MLTAIRKLVSKEIPKAQHEILSSWRHLVIRELVFLPDFQPNGEWISKRLQRLVSPAEANSSIELLQRGGFLKVNAKGHCEAVDPVLDTGEGFHLAQVVSTHLGAIDAWKRLIPMLNVNERELGLLNIPIAAEKMPEFFQRIRRFQDEIIGWLQNESNPDTIVQLGTYLIPLTRPAK